MPFLNRIQINTSDIKFRHFLDGLHECTYFLCYIFRDNVIPEHSFYVVMVDQVYNPNIKPQGQAWLDKTLFRLQQEFESDTDSVISTCDKIKQDTFDSHPRCYADSGLCSLPVADFTTIFGIIEFKDMFGTIPRLK